MIRIALALFFVAAAASAQPFVAVPLRVDPPQSVRAVAINGGGNVVACEVRNGQLLVPSNLPLPWTVSQLRFEPAVYSANDLQAKAPLVLREYGELRVSARPAQRELRALLLRNGDDTPAQITLSLDDGVLRAPLAAGLYAGAFFGDGRGSRIRSGIVISPGQPTELSDIALEPTGAVTLRVVDARSRKPVAGAKVVWSPPAALNADVARVLFSRIWSGTTGRDGTIAFPTIGPPPIPARWAVEARGYAPTLTPQVLISEARRFVAADTALRVESTIIVDARLPRDSAEFHGASLVLSAADEEGTYESFARQPLRDGENKVRLARFGAMRFSIEAKDGRKLVYVDRDVGPDDQRVLIEPLATEISGVVRRRDLPVKGVVVTAADRHDARMIVGRATTDESGRYSFSTFQTGEVLVYSVAPNASTAVLKTVKLDGTREVRLDFRLPTSNATITVVDADSRAPVRANLAGELTDKNGHTSGLFLDTDETGTARITDAREGKAKLFVRAKGYRGRQVTLDVGNDLPPAEVVLQRGGVIAGRVVDRHGAPVANARVLGGYRALMDMRAYLQATTDRDGRFEVENVTQSGAPLYAIARGSAVAVAVLHEGTDNVIRLLPPNSGAVKVEVRDNRLDLFLPAPSGGPIIPYGVFFELAKLNGLSIFQLTSNGADGTLILSEFLAPGTYTLYRMRSTGKMYGEEFDKVTEIRVD